MTDAKELDRMRGVWTMRNGRLAFVGRIDATKPLALPLNGTRVGVLQHRWEPDGSFFGNAIADLDLAEKLGEPDALRFGADLLMRDRNYPAAAVLYALLGDEERTAEAIGLAREANEAEKGKPF